MKKVLLMLIIYALFNSCNQQGENYSEGEYSTRVDTMWVDENRTEIEGITRHIYWQANSDRFVGLQKYSSAIDNFEGSFSLITSSFDEGVLDESAEISFKNEYVINSFLNFVDELKIGEEFFQLENIHWTIILKTESKIDIKQWRTKNEYVNNQTPNNVVLSINEYNKVKSAFVKFLNE